MAKRSRGNVRANKAAEQVGRLLGRTAARVDSWKRQRDALRDDLDAIIAAANDLKGELGTAARTTRRAGRQAKKAVTRASRKVSATARKRMAAAARRRWARYRKAKAAAKTAKK
jgi:hypothetical protein